MEVLLESTRIHGVLAVMTKPESVKPKRSPHLIIWPSELGSSGP